MAKTQLAAGWLLFLILSLITTVAFAQTAAIPLTPARSAAASPAAPAAGAVVQSSQTTAGGDDSAETAEETRVQAITKLEIDRRPSHVLERWAANKSEAEPLEPPLEIPPGPFDLEMKRVQQNIALGQWAEIREYLTGLENKSEAKEVYQVLLRKLGATPSGASTVHPAGRQFQEKHLLLTDDVLDLLLASPSAHDEQTIPLIANLLSGAVRRGNTIDRFLQRLDDILRESGDSSPLLLRPQAAELLHSAGLDIHLANYLPPLPKAVEEDDAEALNLFSHLYIARYGESGEQQDLEEAWRMLQLVLASESASENSQQVALTQAVGLSSRVRKELGQQWLDASFSDDPIRGIQILTTVGKLTTQGLVKRPTNQYSRLQNWRLLATSVEALLETSPARGKQWRETLNLLSLTWLQESELSYRLDRSSSRGPNMRYDSFGNPYFVSDSDMMQMQSSRQNQPQAIPVADLLKHRPSDEWIDLLDKSLQPRFEEWLAKLYLKVQEEENAFPYIEKLSHRQPKIAKTLVNEFLSVWADNHNPNQGRQYRSPIFRIYGFSQRAEGIPLTRSKQERNLRELSQWLERLRQLPVADEIDEKLLVRAFTVCHSSAEVYDLDTIREVFGDIESMAPATIAGLAQKMRTNLSGLWRQPDVQKQSKTNRRKKDIEAEVLRGYIIANQVIEDALKRHAGNWALMAARAALMHDEVNYRHEVSKSSKFTSQRLDALAAFREAARAYADQVTSIEEQKESIDAYQLWFHASLGACDLGQLDAETVPILTEPPLIREAILSLPPEIAKRHMAKFANSLFTELRSVGPAVKYRYLKNGFTIVGDHDQAVDAKKVFDYYDDLVTEIELHAVVDGSTNVGCEQPFGIFVNLRHTREIERESGGFGRYLQNQNNVRYSYNYGRPTENYRDKFEEAVRTALGEHFDVQSVTFQDEDVTSKADSEYGWRTTSYAYILAQARGEEVDRIPPLRLDLDFLESSGYVVLPIESPMVPIDAGQSDLRPVSLLSVVQTLDERQANEGQLILEIKATAHGLIPELEDFVKWGSDGFELASIDDQGVAVSRFDPESDETRIITERLWTVTFQGRSDLEALPTQFTFAEVLADSEESIYQRYADADLETVSRTIELAATYGEKDSTMFWSLVSLIVIVGLGWTVWSVFRKKSAPQISHAIHLPHDITPFSVIGVLREIHRNNGLSVEQKGELEKDIHRLEDAYFAPGADGDADLRSVVENWLKTERLHR